MGKLSGVLMPLELSGRVDNLERLLGEFIVQTGDALHRMERGISDLKGEMFQFKTEAELSRKEMNKKWGDLATKMGTLVEDLIAPALKPVVEQFFQVKIVQFGTNLSRSMADENMEYDIVAASRDMVFVVEVKSKPNRVEYIDRFQESLVRFPLFFPEYRDKTLIGILASIRFPEPFYRAATKRGVYLLGYRAGITWTSSTLRNCSKSAPNRY